MSFDLQCHQTWLVFTRVVRRTTLVNTKSEPKSVSPKERVREFKDEALVVSCGKPFCSACHEQVSLKKSVIKLHVDSQKHKNSKEILHKKEATQRDIAGALTAHVILKVNLYLKMFVSTGLVLLWPSLELVFHYQRLILFVNYLRNMLSVSQVGST